MGELIEPFVLIAGFFVAWNLGANNTANCIGVSVGGGILSYRRAIAIVMIFVILGAVLEGWKNMKTVGEGIITAGATGENPLSAIPYAALASLIATGLWMLAATLLGLPMSVSLSTVGAVFGSGLLITVTQPELGVGIQYSRVGTIAISWLLNPIIAAAVAFVISKILTAALRRVRNILLLNQVLTILVLIASAYSAYALGANDVGASVGAVYGFFGGSSQIIALFGAVALAIGAATFSRRVVATVGSGITSFGPMTAFAAQFGAALTVWSFVQFGIPVSTSEAIVGGIAGMGLSKGVSTVSVRKMRYVLLALVSAPLAALSLSFGIGWLLLSL